MLTNSLKPGPKEKHAGDIYGFAHQAYWGFRFLAENRPSFWTQILEAKTVRSIQEVGRACSQPRAMGNAGYGASGLTVYQLDDQKKPAEFAGQKVAVTGTLDSGTKTIHVSAIKAAP